MDLSKVDIKPNVTDAWHYYDWEFYTFEDHLLNDSTYIYYEHGINADFIHNMGTLLLTLSISSTVISTVLLLTAISKKARSCSVSLYLYHLLFVRVLNAVIMISYHFYDHTGFYGLCMLLNFADLCLIPTNLYSLVLMDIEIIRTLTPNRPCRSESVRRFVISTTATWIVSMLFAIFVLFFGKESSSSVFICYTMTPAAHLTNVIIAEWIPTAIMVVCVCIGSVYFIRMKRNPQHYQHVAEDRANKRLQTEIYVLLMVWNFLEVSTTILRVISQEIFHFRSVFIINITCTVVHYSLPVLCLLLDPFRMVIKHVVLFVIRFLQGRTDVSPESVSDIVALNPV